ncbi:MAG: hypothetical protein WA642_25895 [Steroidobacteraceae bacterium]
MDKNTYLAGIGALYAAEVLGEGLASRWLELTSDPDQKYKLSLLLQLESESKVKLRPLLARHGLSLVEDERQRAAGAAVADRFASAPWKDAMATLADLALPYVHRFQALLDAAPPEDVPLVLFMVDHEQSIVRIAAQEAAGKGSMDRELLVMLSYPIARAG